MKKKRIATGDEAIVWKSPFAVVKNVTLPPAPETRSDSDWPQLVAAAPKKHRGRVDIIRQIAHRGGKTVTVGQAQPPLAIDCTVSFRIVGLTVPKQQTATVTLDLNTANGNGAARTLSVVGR